MKCEDFLSCLDDFLDRRLDAASEEAVASHLEGCPSCAEEVSAIRELRNRAAALPRSEEPTRDLWPGIADRIEETKVVRGRFVRQSLMAAAVVLVLVGSAMTAYLIGRSSAPVEMVMIPTPAADVSGDLGASFAGIGVADFESTRGELLDALEARRHELSPETQQVLEENLELIDDAMVKIAAALREDPESERLMRQLAGAYRQQIGLLERAVRLPADV